MNVESPAVPVNYLTVDETARIGKCSRSTVYRCIARGLPVVRIGHLVRVHEGELHAWLRSQGTR